MIACLRTPALQRRRTSLAAVLSGLLSRLLPGLMRGLAFGLLATSAAPPANAQQVANPGDIIVERDVTPRSAFASVPRNEDPVAVRATTFPQNSFDPMMATLVSDTDLTNAHGSSGVAPGGILNDAAGLPTVARLLSGNPTGSNAALGPTGIGTGNGIGATISSTVTNALAPLSNVVSGALGGSR